MTLLRPVEPPRILTHGRSGYRTGCRCEVCRDGQREYSQRVAARYRQARLDGRAKRGLEHGVADLPMTASEAVVAVLRPDRERWWTSREIADELGTTTNRLEHAVSSLYTHGTLERRQEGRFFRYRLA